MRGTRLLRMDISNEEVKRLWSSCRNMAGVSRKLKCSATLVRNVITGQRRDPEDFLKKPRRHRQSKLTEDGDFCTYCGFRKKKKGNRYLCEWCQDNVSNDDGEDYYSSNVPGGAQIGQIRML